MGQSGNRKSTRQKKNILCTNISGKGTTVDFKQKHSKIGKKPLRADNATSVSFRSKRVQLTSQSILVERDGATVLSSKGKTLAELHRLLKHPTPKVVCEAVVEIRTIAKSLDPAGIEERVSGLCLLPLECLLSSDATVRRELLQLEEIVLSRLSKGAVMTFGVNLCAYATAALNSLDKGIQIDGVSFLNLLLRSFPQILVPHSESLLSALTRLMELQQYLGCSKITGISDLRWSAAKAVLSLLRAVNDTSHKVGNDTSDNEGCGGNLHSGCPSVHIMRRAKRRFGASSAHSQYATTSLVNRSQRESVNLFAVQQPFASTLEWGTTVKEIEGAATCVGEMKSCGEFKISLIGCVVELIAKLTAMYMEVGAVATRDSNLQLVTVCQIAQELMYISPDRTGDFSFGLFRWMNERQPNSRMANLPNAQGALLSSHSGNESLDLALCQLAVACPQIMQKITKELCDSLIVHIEEMIMSPLLTKEQASKISDIIKEALIWHSEYPSRVCRLVRALSSRFSSQNLCSTYFAPILCQVSLLAMREKGKGEILEEDCIKVAALPIVKHMPAGLTLWLKKKDGSKSNSCTYGHIASGLRIVIEGTRRGILEMEESALKSLLQCLFSRVFLAFPIHVCILCVSLVASCSFNVLESCLDVISVILGRMSDNEHSHTRGLLLDTLSQRSKGLSPQLYLRFLLSTLLGKTLEAFLSNRKSHHKSLDQFIKGGETVTLQHQGLGLSSCVICVRDDIVNDVCWCLGCMFRIVEPTTIMLDALTPVLSQMLKCSVETTSSIIPSAHFIILRLQCFRLASKILLSLPEVQLPPSLVEAWASSAASAMSHVRWEGRGGKHTEYTNNDVICSQLCISNVLFDMIRCFPHAYHQLLHAACTRLDTESSDLQEATLLLAGLRACIQVTLGPVSEIVSQGLKQLSLLLGQKVEGPDWGKLLIQSARGLAAEAEVLRLL